jgi:hypothetical protein
VNEAGEDIPYPSAVESPIKHTIFAIEDYLAVILPISGKRLRSTIAGIHATGVV